MAETIALNQCWHNVCMDSLYAENSAYCLCQRCPHGNNQHSLESEARLVCEEDQPAWQGACHWAWRPHHQRVTDKFRWVKQLDCTVSMLDLLPLSSCGLQTTLMRYLETSHCGPLNPIRRHKPGSLSMTLETRSVLPCEAITRHNDFSAEFLSSFPISTSSLVTAQMTPQSGTHNHSLETRRYPQD